MVHEVNLTTRMVDLVEAISMEILDTTITSSNNRWLYNSSRYLLKLICQDVRLQPWQALILVCRLEALRANQEEDSCSLNWLAVHRHSKWLSTEIARRVQAMELDSPQ